MNNAKRLLDFALCLPDYSLDMLPTKRGKRWAVTINYNDNGYDDSKTYRFDTEAEADAAIKAVVDASAALLPLRRKLLRKARNWLTGIGGNEAQRTPGEVDAYLRGLRAAEVSHGIVNAVEDMLNEEYVELAE